MISRILVVGGKGVFGRRLVEGLLATTDVEVIVGGRTVDANDPLVREWQSRYGMRRVSVAIVDREAADETLRRLVPFCVVDAAGPFQGGEPRLARAAIAAGCRYLDLADARDFVASFAALDELARKSGVLAVTGASSTPALSGAALAAMVAGWAQVDDIEIAISPGNRAPRGRSVIEAILAYVGQPVRLWKDACWTRKPGWGDLVRREMPGLGRRWLSLCETPDLDLLPTRYPLARSVTFRAGLELPILHLGLWFLSLPVRWGLIRSLRPLAPFLQRVASWLERFGTDRGGMLVAAQGLNRDGQAVSAQWSLVAEAGDGPHVPVLPALALIRHWLETPVTQEGARIASDLVTLDMIEREFRRFRIRTLRAESWPCAPSLLGRTLGSDTKHLPALIRRIHGSQPIRLIGRASVEAARNPIARILARAFGFPRTSSDLPAEVCLKPKGSFEIWTRRFGQTIFHSKLWSEGQPRCLYERFGPFRFELAIEPCPDGFGLTVTGWHMGFLSLPLSFAPKASALTSVDSQDRYRFDVAITLPLVGPLVRYTGWLMPQDT
ncbi:DUF4166 domain-containing protein [Microvirga rosea]|uniref:DUF4166 domain-containing protein n=1 Tax=Microvirga rosea TaxID=2715425 RepID=UPI001D0A488E|nr:SDR family oxidoreductase [Microvirga rosea]MCB8819059.1 DUF4166 domain-containing protein [Microvirga rosea]